MRKPLSAEERELLRDPIALRAKIAASGWPFEEREVQGWSSRDLQLDGVEIRNTDFSQCIFESAQLTGVSLVDCNLSGVTVENCRLDRTRIAGGSWNSASFSRGALGEISISGAHIQDLEMVDTQFQTVELSDVVTSRVRFERVGGERLSLRGGSHQNLTMEDARAREVLGVGAVFTHPVIVKLSAEHVFFEGCTVTAAEFLICQCARMSFSGGSARGLSILRSHATDISISGPGVFAAVIVRGTDANAFSMSSGATGASVAIQGGSIASVTMTDCKCSAFQVEGMRVERMLSIARSEFLGFSIEACDVHDGVFTNVRLLREVRLSDSRFARLRMENVLEVGDVVTVGDAEQAGDGSRWTTGRVRE